MRRSNSHTESAVSAANDQQFMGTALGVLGALVAITVLIIIAANLVGGDDDALQEAEIRQIEARVQPVAMVATDASQLPKPEEKPALDLSAAEINEQFCAACHANGTLGAPVFGNADAWASRLEEKGRDTLVSHAINGFNQMPARGGNPDLSDEDIEKTVDYMLEEAGV